MAGQRTNLNLEEIRSYLNEGYEIFLKSKKTTREIVGMQKTYLMSILYLQHVAKIICEPCECKLNITMVLLCYSGIVLHPLAFDTLRYG
jgi:hypothetical protein